MIEEVGDIHADSQTLRFAERPKSLRYPQVCVVCTRRALGVGTQTSEDARVCRVNDVPCVPIHGDAGGTCRRKSSRGAVWI